MTVRNDHDIPVITEDRNYRRSSSEQVDVAPGVPTDRVRWGPILAGMFAALTILALLSALGAAIGLSTYDAGDNARRYAIGAGVWGIISMIVAFAFGGWLAARSSAVHGGDNGLLNGFMVAAVGIPALLLAMGSASVLMAQAEVANDRDLAARGQFDGEARTASAVMSGAADENAGAPVNEPSRTEEARHAAKRTAWSTLLALALTIGAASLAGLVGGRDDRHVERNPRDRVRM